MTATTERTLKRDITTFVTLTGLLAFMAVATDLYLPAIPAMTQELGGSISDGQLTLSIFMLGVACGQLVFGPLSDHYGRLPVVRAGAVGFIVFSLISAFAWSIEYVWTARLFHGAVAASGPVIARAMIRDRYEGDRAAQIMALTSASMALLPLIAPTLGAIILVEFGWRATFVVLALYAVACLLGLSTFEETAPAKVSGAPAQALTLSIVFSSFGACLQHPRFIGYQLAGTFSFCGLFVYLSTVSFFLSDVFNVPTKYFGLAFAVSVTGFLVGSLTSSRLVLTLGQDKTMIVGTVVCTLSTGIALFVTSRFESAHLLLAGLSTGFFFGVGLVSANASMGAVSLFAEKAGAASAVYGSVHSLSSALIGAIAGLTYSGRMLEPIVLMFLCATGSLMGSFIVSKTTPNAAR